MTPSIVEAIYEKASITREHRRQIAQAIYDVYEFDRKVESGRPETAWMQMFDGETPVMVRRLTVFPQTDSGGEGKLGWFKVEFDKSGTTVTDAYACIKANEIFGNLPKDLLAEYLSDPITHPANGWKM